MQEFSVTVNRTSYSTHEFRVRAASREEAQLTALQRSGDVEFSPGSDPDYEVVDTRLVSADILLAEEMQELRRQLSDSEDIRIGQQIDKEKRAKATEALINTARQVVHEYGSCGSTMHNKIHNLSQVIDECLSSGTKK